jgi:hypothetical protein
VEVCHKGKTILSENRVVVLKARHDPRQLWPQSVVQISVTASRSLADGVDGTCREFTPRL